MNDKRQSRQSSLQFQASSSPPAYEAPAVSLEIEELGEAVARRTRNLLAPAPIFDLERDKGARGIDLSQHDLRMLCLALLDVVIDKMGFAQGATRRDVAHALAPILQGAEPGISDERKELILDVLIGTLLNERERRQQFVERYAAVEYGQVCWREFAYRLLEEAQSAESDERIFRASPEAINLYTSMLGLNLEDAAVADAAVLRYQAERGRLDDAIHTAHQAQIRAKAYADKVRRALEIARRNADEARWVKDVLPLIADALEHIRDRLSRERDLRAGLEQRRDRASGEDLAKLTILLNEVEKSERANLELHNLLIRASEKFREEHSRQRLRRRAALLPNLEPEVFVPWLGWEGSKALSMLESHLNILSGHTVPTPPGIEQLWAKLLSPPTALTPRTADVDLPSMDALPASLLPFGSEDYSGVRDFLRTELDGKRRLSEMLEAAKARRLSAATRRLFVITAMEQYGADGERQQFRVQTQSEPLIAEDFAGDELLLSPLARFFDRALRTVQEYNEKIQYIHLNPVRAGLTRRPEDWPWSSVHDYQGRRAGEEAKLRLPLRYPLACGASTKTTPVYSRPTVSGTGATSSPSSYTSAYGDMCMGLRFRPGFGW